MDLKNWLFVIGVGLIVLVGLGSIADARDARRLKERSSGVHAGYLFAVLDLLCIVNLLDWRHRLVRLGLQEAWSWVLAPIGLILVIAASLASWGASYGEGDNHPRWVWIVALVVYLAAAFGYLTVASESGLSAWFKP